MTDYNEWHYRAGVESGGWAAAYFYQQKKLAAGPTSRQSGAPGPEEIAAGVAKTETMKTSVAQVPLAEVAGALTLE